MRDFFKKWPKFYYLIANTVGPALIIFKGSKYFIKKYGEEGVCLNLGSGPWKVGKNFKNVDLFKYENVDVVSDISKTPFESSSVDRIVIDNVLEHVEEPKDVVKEMKRIMKTGAVAYVSVPFIYPFHSSPYDFNRWTHLGLRKLFGDFEILELGTRSGVFSSLNTLLVYLFANILCFGNNKLYTLFENLFIFVFFPIKFLDLLFFWVPQNLNTACVFYMIVRKK